MPLLVTLICPSRNALLLFGSSHDGVPGTKVRYISLPSSSALKVSGLLMTTWFFSSPILPPNAHTSQWHQEFSSPVALPSANPGGVPFAFSALHSSRKPAVSFGNSLKPAACTWLMRCVKQAPAAPSGTAIHLPPDMP